ncbi:MAG TPA: type II secretion system minor pseudopilin GspJ [Gammaproteobacteria bacterium]|nr:type II secretion system minor pseudopilin GspJ [Gammaproteobacteria bacterium]
MRRRSSRGFTLIELLVAIAIFAVIAALAYGGLDGVVRQREQTTAAMQQLRSVQLAVSIMARDFSQLVPRSIRGALQGTPLSAFSGAPQNLPQVEFTRGGWSNPLAEVRSTQQRVAYQLDNGTLLRLSWTELDRASQNPPLKQELLTGVTTLSFRYMDGNGQWQEQWPPLNSNPNQYLTRLPRAVEIKLNLKDLGELTRMIEVHRNADGS